MRNSGRIRICQIAALLALPTLLFCLASFQRKAQGPYWSANVDPDYIYLLNGLLIAQGMSAAYSDHPGTSLHLFNAGVILAKHMYGGDGMISMDVLSRPEAFLRTLSAAFVLGTCLSLALAGAVVAQRAKSLSLGILVQAGAFLGMASLESLHRVNPEPVLLSLSAVFAVVLYIGHRYGTGRQCLVYSAATGVLAGISLAAKITFMPLLVLPLIVFARARPRIVYAAAAGLTFCLLVFCPLVNTGMYIFNFATEILLHTGQYGHGAPGLFTWQTLVQNTANWAVAVGRTEWPVLLAVGSSIAVLVWRIRALGFTAGTRKQRWHVRLLFAILVAEAGQLVMAIKSPTVMTRYLVPGHGLLGMSLVLTAIAAGDLCPARRPLIRAAFLLAALGLVVLCQVPRCLRNMDTLAEVRDQRLAVRERVARDYPDARVVYYSITAAPGSALWFGNLWAVKSFTRQLSLLYPDFLYFNTSTGAIENYAGSVDAKSVLTDDAAPVLLQGEPDPKIDASPWAEVLVPGQAQRVYRLDPLMREQL